MGLRERFEHYQLYELEHKPRTAKMYIRRLTYAERLVGKPIEVITPEDMRDLKRRVLIGELVYSREHIKGIMVAVRQFHDWGALEGLWPLNGISKVRPIKTYNGKPNPLPLRSVQILLGACRRPLEFRLIYLGLFAGCRIGESATFWGEQWTDDGWLRFVGAKNDEIREVPVHPELAAVRWNILAHPPTYDSTLQRVKRRLEARTGIRFVAHQLRDTFSTYLYDSGADDRVVKDMIGHDLGTTGIYIEVSRRRKQETMSGLDYRKAA